MEHGTDVPMLVSRVRDLKSEMIEHVGFHEFDKRTWHRLGIDESINLPSERP